MAQWQVGKTYQLVDYEGFIAADSYGNGKIYGEIGYSEFKVIEVNSSSRVVGILVGGYYYRANDMNLTFIFKDEDLQYFKLVDDLPETKLSPDEIVIDWLDKLYYVLNNDTNADTAVNAGHISLLLRTDTVDICGSADLYEFINTRYNQLHEVNQKELQSKREQLLAELAEIDKQLNIK